MIVFRGTATAAIAVCGVGLAAALSACAPAAATPSPRTLRIATGANSGVYHLLGRRIAEIYNARVPGARASTLETTGSGFNVRAVEEGAAELAFSQADVAYLASQKGSSEHRDSYSHLRTIAVLYVNAVQIVTLARSSVHDLDDLAGKRVGVGAPDSGTEVAACVVLGAKHLEHRVVSHPLGFDELALDIQREAVDAGFFVSSYPLPAIVRLNAATNVRLLSIDQSVALQIRGTYPFLRPVVIPATAYSGQRGNIATIGVDNLLLCRSDLPDDLVYELTRALIESLQELADVHPAAAAIGPEQARSAVVPLHQGAARFYRERELFR